MEEPNTNMPDEKDREWFENQLAWWLELSAGENEMACRKELQENQPEDFTDEDYVRIGITVKTGDAKRPRLCSPGTIIVDKVFPAYIGRIARDILRRKLCIDRNSEVAGKMLDYNEIRLFEYAKEDREREYQEGIEILAEAVSMTGEVQEDDALYSWEKQMLNCKSPERVSQCIRSGFLVRERVEEYLYYVRTEGARELLPMLVNLKFNK